MTSRMISILNGEDLILRPELMNTLDVNYFVGNPDDNGYFSITWPANYQRQTTFIMDCHWIWQIDDDDDDDDEVQDDESMNSIVSIDDSSFFFKEPESRTVYFDEWGPLVEGTPETNPFMHGHPLNRELWDEVHQAQTDPDHHIPLDTYITVSSDASSLLQDEPETDPIAAAG